MTKKQLDGVGRDTPIETNKQGGLGAKPPAFIHLIDPGFTITLLQKYVDTHVRDEIQGPCDVALMNIESYIITGDLKYLFKAMEDVEPNFVHSLFEIGARLQYGATKYAINNWRLCSREEHLNHALIHLLCIMEGDTQDDHKKGFLCRMMMAISTVESEGFDYLRPPTPEKNAAKIMGEIYLGSQAPTLNRDSIGDVIAKQFPYSTVRPGNHDVGDEVETPNEFLPVKGWQKCRNCGYTKKVDQYNETGVCKKCIDKLEEIKNND